MKVKRREFLKTAGVFGVGVAVYNPALKAFAKADKTPEVAEAGTWVSTTCQGCTTWCPIQLNVQNGRVTKVRGNTYSKANPGYCCPKAHMIPSQQYDPDRLKTPMQRTNSAKGRNVDPQFTPITWAAALTAIATEMLNLRNNGEAHKYVLFRGRYTYSRDIIYSAMTKIMGSPNGISHSSICAEVEKAGTFYTVGEWLYRDYDYAKTKFIAFWGTDPFRANRNIPVLMDKWKTMVANGCKSVTIDPLYNGAAAKSDKWFPIKPGEDGALASALAHHILVNDLWNKDFVGNWNTAGSFTAGDDTVNPANFTETETKGLVTWWNEELFDKTPAWAFTKTGIPAADIEQMAEDMAEAAPNVIIYYGPTMTPRGTYTAMACNALNGLMGSFDNEGGPMTRAKASYNKIPSYSAFQDAIAIAGTANAKIDQRGTEFLVAATKGVVGSGVVTGNVANAMLAADPYDIKMCVGYRNNFGFSIADSERWYDALGDNNTNGAPFTVHITTHASEFSQFADIVLPASFDGVETWALLHCGGNLYDEISMQQPIATKLWDTRQGENEIPWDIAEELDNQGFSEMFNYYSTSPEFQNPITAAAPTNRAEFAQFSTMYFTQPGWDAGAMVGGWTEMMEKGVYSEGPHPYKAHWQANGGWNTNSGFFEFYSEDLEAALTTHATTFSKTVDQDLEDLGYTPNLGAKAFVPHYEPPKRNGTLALYPYDFIDCKSRFNREGRSANNPLYYQFKKLDPGDINWGDCIKMNPVDATAEGLVDGDIVDVASLAGTIRTVVKVWEGVRPGCVAKTYGQGHWAYGRFASDYANLTETANAGNNNDIIVDDYDRITGSSARNGGSTGVSVTKV